MIYMCVCACVCIHITTIHKNDSMYVKLNNKQINNPNFYKSKRSKWTFHQKIQKWPMKIYKDHHHYLLCICVISC